MHRNNIALLSLVKALELPTEIVVDEPLITIVGNYLITIENYTTLMQYTTDEIKLFTKSGILKITGNNIKINEIGTGKISILGNIVNIDYSDCSKG
jgi:sporulation protein YqfC